MPFSATRDLWLVLKARDEASRAMGAFSRDIRMVGDSVRLANLQSARSALQNHLAIQRMTGASQQDLLVTQRRIQAIDQEIGSMRVQRAEMEEQRVSSQRLATALQGAAGMATAVGTGLVAAGAFGLMGLKKLIDASVEYERQSALTATQVDKFALSIKDVEAIGLRVARNVGVEFSQIQPALFDIFSSMEVNAKQAEDLLTIFSKAAVAGQVDIIAASKATIGILNAFQLPLSSINHLMDVQFQLVKEGIGSYEDWTARIGQVTPSAVRFGQSVDMMAAALAASTRTGQLAAQSASAVARAMDAMSNPAAVASLKALGVNATDAKGNFRSMIDILFDFRKALDKIPGESNKIAALLDVFKGAGGTIQARRFLQNMLITPGNLELFQSIFKQIENSTGSFEQAYSIMADTTATKTQLIANKWESLKVAAGNALAPAFLRVLELLGKIFDKFNNLSPETQKTIMKWLAFAAAGSLVAGILLLVVGLVAGLAAAFAVAGSAILIVMGLLVGVGAALAGLGAMFVVAWKKSAAFRDAIEYAGVTLKILWYNIIVPFAQDVAKQFDDKIMPPLRRFAEWFKSDALPKLKDFQVFLTQEVMPRIKELANWLKDRLGEAFAAIGWAIDHIVKPAFNWISDWYDKHKDTIKQIVDWIVWFATQYGKYLMIILGVLLVVFAGPIVGIIVAFIALLFGIVAVIVYIVEAVKHVIDWFSHFGEHMDWLGKHLSDFFSMIGDFFSSLPSRIVSVIGDLGETLIHAGENLIEGLIKGVQNKMPSLGNVAGAVAGFIKSFFPHSPAKRGPLAGSGGMYYSGQKLVEQLQDGINSKVGIINSGASLVANAAGTSATVAAGVGTGSSINQNITVNTQELNPRRQAAELGWLLAGSM